ncbi:hypothetical protein [Ottowia sp.]|uniref:hypothetical protein n=1 Tax=Ottowia sp. TaxID=1898956 RepID=UPI0025CF4EE5|nr:hypothetical protein [Ottowia sp.]MBK6616363.1 hypothetical protein [Ottowia sp.]
MRKRQKATISLIEFLRPGGHWPYPYSVEMAFHVFHWMIASGSGYSTPGRWVTASVGRLLGGANADNSYPTAITSLADLKRRFQVAFFESGAECIDRWRMDQGINAYGEVELRFPHFKPMQPLPDLGFGCERDLGKALEDLLCSSAGKVLRTSLNSIHKTATVVHRVDVTVCHRPPFLDGFSFVLRYGFKTPGAMAESGDSEWEHCLAATSSGESFAQTLARALDEYRRIEAGTWTRQPEYEAA